MNGTLPKEGTICNVESSIFGDASDLNLTVLSKDDRELLEASKELQGNYPVPLLF